MSAKRPQSIAEQIGGGAADLPGLLGISVPFSVPIWVPGGEAQEMIDSPDVRRALRPSTDQGVAVA